MLFLSSLLIAAVLSVLCGEAIRKHPAPFYLAAAVLSVGTVIIANQRISEIPVILQYCIPAFTKGTLAAAFWAVIMWTGALPNGSALIKKLMPQRGQLSIFAAILTLGHAVGLGISMVPRWLKKADILNIAICILFMAIMLPLTIMSVRTIRKKMKAKTWKSIQRFAYIFYALIPAHVIALNLAKARNGKTEVLFSLVVYLVVFLGYAVCRVRKFYLLKKKPERPFGANAAACCAFLFGMAIFSAAAFPKEKPETIQTADAVQHTETTQITAASTGITTAETSQNTTKKTTATTENTGVTKSTENSEDIEKTTAQEHDETTSISETITEQIATEEKPNETVTETVPEPAQTEEPQPVRIYQDGTFTATAYGYDGNITVHVTIENDVITNITAETEESDDSYFLDAKNVVIPAIIANQMPDVDACSGATYSSNGIMAAVRAALESARI